MSAADASDVIMRLAPTTDDAIPNAHPVYLSALIRLAGLTGDDTWLKRADQLFATLAPIVRGNFVGHAGILNALDLRLNGLEIVTAGPERQALYEAALATPFDHRIVFDLDRPEPCRRAIPPRRKRRSPALRRPSYAPAGLFLAGA